MVAAALITLREGLEAALIVGIVLAVLRRLGEIGRRRAVWAGTAAAVLVSIAGGLGLNALGVAFEGHGEEVFEGTAMLLAAAVLTWMIIWMQRQGRQIELGLEEDVRRATTAGSAWALFSLAFIAVVREGIETVLFLTAASFSATPVQTLLGGALGLAAAIIVGVLVFGVGRQVPLRPFFRVTGILLILFAAGLVAHGVHELQEAGILPTIIEHVWDINHVVDEGGGVGTFLKAIFGYNENPSLIEVLSYVGYFSALLLTTWVAGRRRSASSRPGPTPVTSP